MAAISQSDIEAAHANALSFLRINQVNGSAAGSGSKNRSALNISGWFPYRPGAQASLEATAWAALALRGEPLPAKSAALFIVKSQNKDGGDSTVPGAGRSDWNSGPAMLSLRLLSHAQPELAEHADVRKSIKIGFAHLLDSRTEFYNAAARLVLLLGRGPSALAYARGWPWHPGCFHWIEPTAYSLMALKFPQVPDIELYVRVINFANEFITDNVCKDGGWNHGNARTLGSELPSYRLTTAEALLALQDLQDTPTVQGAVRYLHSLSNQDSSSLSVAFSALALSAYSQSCDQEISFLLKRQAKDGSFSSAIVQTAIAALALEAKLNPERHVLKKSGSKA